MEVGYRYWHYTSGAFFDAVVQMKKDHQAAGQAWFDFAKRFGGVPAQNRAWSKTYCSGVISSDPIDGWRSVGWMGRDKQIYVPHGVKSKALLKEFNVLPAMIDIAEDWGFEEAIKNGRNIVTPTCDVYGKPPQIVYVQVYHNEESDHKPPEGGRELLKWEWEKWIHDLQQQTKEAA